MPSSKQSASYSEFMIKLEDELYKFIKDRVIKEIRNNKIKLTTDMFCRQYQELWGGYDVCVKKIQKELETDQAFFDALKHAEELVVDIWLRRRVSRLVKDLLNAIDGIEERAVSAIVNRVIEHVLEPKYGHDHILL